MKRSLWATPKGQTDDFCAACGSLEDEVIVRDNGDGSCRATARVNGMVRSGACNFLPFNNWNCINLNSSLTVIFSRAQAAPPYLELMAEFLAALGLGNLRIITRTLTIYVDHKDNPVPTINPRFLFALQQVSQTRPFGP
jgi:hypothetical protein